MMYAPLSSRQNPNLPKLLSLLLVLLTLALLYQHYSNKQVQGVLERDISISRQRAKQVEKELDAIQKGLQLDLNKEKSEHEKVKNELQQVKFSMESMASQHSQKERTCQQYYEELEGCRSEKESCIENVDKLSISVSQCVGEKNANIQSISNMQSQVDKASSDRMQMTSQIEMLQNKLAQKEAEFQQMYARFQGQQGFQGQQPMGQGQPIPQGQGQPMMVPNQYSPQNQPVNPPGAQNYGGNEPLNQPQFAAGFQNQPGMNVPLPFNNPNMPQNYQQYGHNRNNALYLDKQQQQPNDNNGRPPAVDRNVVPQPKVENQEVINNQAAGGEFNRKVPQNPVDDSSPNDIAKVPQNWRGQELVVNKGDENAEAAAKFNANAGPAPGDAVVDNRPMNPNEFNGANASRTVGNNATKHMITTHKDTLNASKITNKTATNQVALKTSITGNLSTGLKVVPRVENNPPMMQPPQQVGAPGEDKHVQNPAEVDHVPGDGQGALLPPMGQAERKAMEDRINNGGVAQGDNAVYKRGDAAKPDLLEEPAVKVAENIAKDELDFPIGAPEGDRNIPNEEDEDEDDEDRPVEANIQDQKPDNDRNDQLFDANDAAPGDKRDYKNEVHNDRFGNGQDGNVQNVAPIEKDQLNNDFNDVNDKDIANIPDFEQNRK